jgi:hypothetical protein
MGKDKKHKKEKHKKDKSKKRKREHSSDSSDSEEERRKYAEKKVGGLNLHTHSARLLVAHALHCSCPSAGQAGG